MIDDVLRDKTIPARQPHVDERHARVEQFRPVLLQYAANFRFTAVQLEVMLTHTPDADAGITSWMQQISRAGNELQKAVDRYRALRDVFQEVKGEA